MLITNKSLATIETYERDVRLFLLSIDNQEVKTIDRGRIEEYLHQLVHEGIKESVIKKKYASIKAFFRFLEEQKITCNNPMEKPIKIPKNLSPVEVKLERNYVEKIIASTMANQEITLRDKLIICLTLVSGLSIVRLTEINTDEVKKLTFSVKISAEIKTNIKVILDKYLVANNTQLLFLNGRQQPLNYRYIRKLMIPFMNQNKENVENFHITITN